jgi:hypothetical protein
VRLLAFILVALALSLTACSSGSDRAADEQPGPAQDTTPTLDTTPAQDTTPQQTPSGHRFKKDELAQIVLQPSDAPPGMKYTKEQSGAKTLEELGFVVKADLNEIHALRIRAIRDAIFDASDGRSRLASRFWLFAQPQGADAWLEKSRNDATRFALEPAESPSLGDDSWAARGVLNGFNVLTYAFRSDNVVAVVSMLVAGESEGTDSTALAAAQKAADRLSAS